MLEVVEAAIEVVDRIEDLVLEQGGEGEHQMVDQIGRDDDHLMRVHRGGRGRGNRLMRVHRGGHGRSNRLMSVHGRGEHQVMQQSGVFEPHLTEMILQVENQVLEQRGSGEVHLTGLLKLSLIHI